MHQSTALTSELESLLLRAFNIIPLSEFVTSPRLVDGFRGFLERGSRTDQDIILNNQSRATPASSNDASNLLETTSEEDIPSTIFPPASRPATTITQRGPYQTGNVIQLQPNADKPFLTASENLKTDLTILTNCNDPVRIQRLVQVIEALQTAARLPSRSYQTLWSAREGLFDGAEIGYEGWMCRLVRGRKRIKDSHDVLDCASRLSLMFMGQFVDHMEKWMGLPLKSGRRGVSRRTLACREVSKHWGVELKKVKRYNQLSGTYFYLLDKAGPGILLEIGSKVTSLWEKLLTQSDVDVILAYIKDKLPELEARHKQLNGIAARTFHTGLVACGWDAEALAKPTRLTNSIKLYIDEQDPPETSISINSNQPGPKRSHDDHNHLPNKRRSKHSKQTVSSTPESRNGIENHPCRISIQSLVTVEQGLHIEGNERDTAQDSEVRVGVVASPYTNTNPSSDALASNGCSDDVDHGADYSGLHFNMGISEDSEMLNLSSLYDLTESDYDLAADLPSFMYDPLLDLPNFIHDPASDLHNLVYDSAPADIFPPAENSSTTRSISAGVTLNLGTLI